MIRREIKRGENLVADEDKCDQLRKEDSGG